MGNFDKSYHNSEAPTIRLRDRSLAPSFRDCERHPVASALSWKLRPDFNVQAQTPFENGIVA